MGDWKLKRFWSVAEVAEAEGGHAIHLDGRVLRTPAKAPLIVPYVPLAQAIAEEWAAQEHDKPVNPQAMPLTRTANSAVDKVAPQMAQVVEILAEYGGCDLLCYRAEAPDGLIARQAAAWDPLLDWSAATLAAPLVCGQGVSYVSQPGDSLSRLHAQVDELDQWQLAAFHDLVALTGSLVIGFAAARNVVPASELWTISRVDEIWQEDLWGHDDIAAQAAERKQNAFLDAHRFFSLCSQI